MNLFDNILNQSKNKFLGTQPSVPSTPSFITPQAPRTSSYVAPNVPYTPSPTMTLFSDEQEMFKKMKADNLDDNTAYSMLKKRRMDILGGNDITQEETDILKRMQADNVPVKQAVSMIQQRRKDQFNKKYEEGNLLQKGAYNTLAFGAGNLETLAKYSGNALDFITGGTMGFGDEVKKMEQVTQSPEFSQSSAFKAGTYAPDVALAISPIGGGYLAGAKGLPQLAMRSGIVGAGFGGVQPILEQGSDVSMGDIATGAATGAAVGAVASPVLSKAFKYGQAGYYGGLEGAGKSIARDVKGGLNAITPSGANISTKANRFNANEIREFTKRTGQSPGEFATSRGMTKVGDDAVVEATRLWQASKDQADEALQAIKGRFRFTDEGEDLLKTTIDDLETRLINTKSPDAKRISQLKAKYEDSGLTMSEINEIKRAYSNNYKYSFVDAGSESALRSRNLQDAVRKWQFKVAEENGLTNLKEINKTTQGWKMFADSLSKKIQGSSGNNNVSLTDWIALSGGSPENIALYLGKKIVSSDKVKSGAIKLFSKKTKPSIIEASKADIQQANFKKDVNRGVSGVGDNSVGKSLVRPVGLLPAPSGKATGAKNFRVNQPKEKTPIKNEGQVGNRPGTKATIKTPESVKLAKEQERLKSVIQVERDLNSALLSKNFGNKPQQSREFIDRAMNDGKLTRDESIGIIEKIYENADGFNKKHYAKLLDDLYSNKPILEITPKKIIPEKPTPKVEKPVESWDDLLNEKQPVAKPEGLKTTIKLNANNPIRAEYLRTNPKGMYENIRNVLSDNRYSKETVDKLIAEFKEKTGVDLNVDFEPKFDADGNVIRTIITPKKPIVKPNTIKNESKGITPKPKTEGVKPSPQVKPVEKRAYNSNLTESELKDATKGAKTREEYNKMAMEAGIKKINAQNEKLYKGKTISYERNGKSYNIEFDKNPDTFLLAKEMVDDAKIPYKIKENTQKIVKPVEKTSATQANGPSVLGKMGKVETNTTLQSPTSYEEGMRRPFTMGNNKPIVKRASDSDNGLIEEARKYKSAEEFVNSKKLYHGTSIEKYQNIQKTGFKTPRELAKDGRFEIMMMEDHISFTGDKKVAERYALRDKNGGKLVEIDKSDLKLLNDKNNRWKDGEEWTDYIKRLEKEGYDGIDGSLGHPDFKDYYQAPGVSGDTEVLIWNTKKIKEMTKETKEQLKQIYEKSLSTQKTVKHLTEGKQSATMGDMETKKLIEEARKTPVYHGTNVEFKEFDPKRINTVESSGDYIGEGFYFTTSKESAKKYAQQAVKKKGGKEIIKEVTLDMKKPFIINSKSDIKKLNDIFGGEDNRIELLLDNPKAVREKLQSLGYDGLIDNLYGQRAVFNAKQIISK